MVNSATVVFLPAQQFRRLRQGGQYAPLFGLLRNQKRVSPYPPEFIQGLVLGVTAVKLASDRLSLGFDFVGTMIGYGCKVCVLPGFATSKVIGDGRSSRTSQNCLTTEFSASFKF